MFRGTSRGREKAAAGGDRFVHDNCVFRDRAAQNICDAAGVQRAGGFVWRDALRDMGGGGIGRARAIANRGQGTGDILRCLAQVNDICTVSGQDRGLARIGEKADWCTRADQNDTFVRLQRLKRLINRVRDAVDGDAPCPALQPRVRPFA